MYRYYSTHRRIAPMYHDRVDSLLNTYARKLTKNLNANYSIQTRCPSILIAGGSNFPVAKKEKQNRAADRNMQEWKDIQGILDKIRSTGKGGISSDDPAGWDFDGGKVVINTDENRIQVLFDEKPDNDTRTELRGAAFKWAPTQGAWQRQLTQNAENAARRILGCEGKGGCNA